jgi:hypothetical protein
MNLRRLSTNIKEGSIVSREELQQKIEKLLNAPSNFEIKEDGRVFIKSLNRYYYDGSSIKVNIQDAQGKVLNSFDSIRSCADYLGITPPLAKRRILSHIAVMFNNQKVFITSTEEGSSDLSILQSSVFKSKSILNLYRGLKDNLRNYLALFMDKLEKHKISYRKGIFSEGIAYSKNIITSNLNLSKIFKLVVTCIIFIITTLTGIEIPEVFCQGMDTDGDDSEAASQHNKESVPTDNSQKSSRDSGGDLNKESGQTDNSQKSSKSEDSADDDYFNQRMKRIHDLMIQHTEETFLKDIDEGLKENNLFYKDDSELTEAERQRREELISQRDNTVDFLAKELETKAKLDSDDIKKDNSNISSNKRNIIHAEEEEGSFKKRK